MLLHIVLSTDLELSSASWFFGGGIFLSGEILFQLSCKHIGYQTFFFFFFANLVGMKWYLLF